MRIWKLFPVVFILFGCAILPFKVPSLPPTGAQPQPAIQSPTLASNPPVDQSPVQNPGQPVFEQANGSFVLKIFSPADQTVTNEPQIDVTGEVSQDAVLTINEDTNVVHAGPFKQTVALTEGPNDIEIIASDMAGNEVDLILTITYQP